MKSKNRFLSLIMVLTMLLSIISFPTAVYADTVEPDINIFKSISKTSFVEGETGTITYTITPTGTKMNASSDPADIVLVLDVSLSMKGSKLTSAKAAAKSFVDKLNGSGHKIALVTFGYKVNYSTALSSNYTNVKNYINNINSSDTFEGTNYDDAMLKAISILEGGSLKNKYVVFLSDGDPNYFTSDKAVKKYEDNPFSKYENKNYYLTNWPKNTPEASNNAKNNARDMGEANITMYTIGLGKKHEVDLNFLKQLAHQTGGKSYHSADENSLEEIYNSISADIKDTKITNINIIETLPAGVVPASEDGIIVLTDGKVQIPAQEIEYKSNSSAPAAFNVSLEVVFKKSGEYSLNGGSINYQGWDGVNKSKLINTVNVIVKAVTEPPGMLVSRKVINNTVVEGETVNIKYTFSPTGVFTEEQDDRQPADIVLVIDKSLSMDDVTAVVDNGNNGNHYGWDNKNKKKNEASTKTKMSDARDAAKAFVNSIEASGFNDRIAVVSFNRYSTIDAGLTTDYDDVINSIDAIKPMPNTWANYYQQGTNYEIGLNTAKKILEGSNGPKYIVFLSDGEPNFYVDAYSNHQSSSYYNSYDWDFYEYLWYYLWYHDNPYQKAYDAFYKDYKLDKLNVDYGDYTYYDTKTVKRSYSDTEEKVKEVAGLGITLYTVGVGKPEDLDMDFMAELAATGGGNAYGSSNSADLIDIFTNISEQISQQKLSNITASITLPENVQVLEDIGLTQQGNVVTFRIPDIVFEKDMGTPAPIEYTLKLKFMKKGTYNLNSDSSVEFVGYDGKNNLLKLNDVTIEVLSADYAISELKSKLEFQGQAISGISLSWNPKDIDAAVIDNVKEFVIERSINGSAFTEITRVSNQTASYFDENVTLSGAYVYRIKTVVKGSQGKPDEYVEGAASAALNVVKGAPEIVYSITELTNQDVTATLVAPQGVEITVLNNGGSKTYTFTENDEFVFEYRDSFGNTGTVTARVDYIDKEAPTAEIEYSTTLLTNQNVVVTLVPNENVTVINNGGLLTYEFETNGEFTFFFKDAAGNTGTAKATVENIDKLAPTASIVYSTTKYTLGSVYATLSNISESITVTNNGGSLTRLFTENGIFTFEFVDAAGNTGIATAMVENIITTNEEELSSLKLSTKKDNTNTQTSVIQGGSLEFNIQLVRDEAGYLTLVLDCFDMNSANGDYSDMFFNSIGFRNAVTVDGKQYLYDDKGNMFLVEKTDDGSRNIILKSMSSLEAGITYNIKIQISIGQTLPIDSYKMQVVGSSQYLQIDVVELPPLL